MANKNLLKLRFLFYLLLAVCLFLIALKPAGRFLQIEDDLKELKGKISNKTIEYRSERALETIVWTFIPLHFLRRLCKRNSFLS